VEDSPTRGMHIRNTLHISLNQKNIRTNSDINELSVMAQCRMQIEKCKIEAKGEEK